MPAAPVHHTAVDKDSPWDGPAAEKAFDKKAGDFVKFYAWVDEGEADPDADGKDKEDGWGPHHEVGSDGVPGAANLKGVESAMAALNGAHGNSSVIPDGDRQGVWDHLAAHYKDAGIDAKDIPELKSASSKRDVGRRKPRARRELERQPELRVLRVGGDRKLEVRDGAGTNDGLVEVTGQVIVYETPYEVYDMFGSFTETIHFGAAAPVLAGEVDCRFLFGHESSSLFPLARTGAITSLGLTDTPEALCISALIDPRLSAAADLIVSLENKTITQMSVGMVVDPQGDVWSGEDDWGLPNVRDIYRLTEILDVSAVTYPASPTTSIELAQRMWGAVPIQTKERARRLWTVARDIRSSRQVSQSDADALMHVMEELYTVDTSTTSPRAQRNQPTEQDAVVSDDIAQVLKLAAKLKADQSKDPDANTDPVDKKVSAAIDDLVTCAHNLADLQAKDGAPDAETKSAGDYQGDPDGTQAGGAGNAPVPDNEDGTGSRSLSVDIDLDLMRLRRRPAA